MQSRAVGLNRTQLTQLNDLLAGTYRHETSGPYEPEGRLVPAYAFDLEAILHEFSHLAVFNAQPHGNEHQLPEMVSTLFNAYASPLASDRAECRALAVQLLVVKRLGLRIHVRRLCRDAAMEMRSDTFYQDAPQVIRAVRHYRALPLAQQRAERVLSWLQPLIDQVSYRGKKND